MPRTSALTALAAVLPAAASASASASTARRQLIDVPAAEGMVLGMSYGPVPLTKLEEVYTLPEDDWFCDEAVRMWSRAGRGDLRVMKDMGANLVRLYGNNPENDHTNFLDEAWELGLGVAPGMSDWPYYQMVPGRCSDSEYNCFAQVKESYKKNLAKGFLRSDGSYHPALRYMNILNEPDLKMPPTSTTGGPDGPLLMGRTLISAFDAMLQAEKEAGVQGHLINFTATFSYAMCGACTELSNRPALGQMWTLDDAMRNPDKYGYSPINDITAAYLTRFTHSFNTQNPATDLQTQFLDDYLVYFPNTPVYIGEYHRVGANQTEDLGLIVEVARKNPLFKGISFFQFQVAYWKAGPEQDFGMFGLHEGALTHLDYFSQTYDVRCLAPVHSPLDGYSVPEALTHVYRGPGVSYDDLCDVSPLLQPLTPDGFKTVLALGKPWQTAKYVEKVIHHLGAVVDVEADGGSKLLDLSRRYGESTHATPLASLAEELAGSQRPDWVAFDTTHARCAADRGAQPRDLGKAIGWACSQTKTFSCDDLPEFCKASPYRAADWIFSRLYKELGADANPLTMCDFDGTAIYASAQLYNRWSNSLECLEGGVPTPVMPPVTTPAPSSSPERPTTTEPSETTRSTSDAASTSSSISSSSGSSTGSSSTSSIRGSTSVDSSTTPSASTTQYSHDMSTSTTRTEKLFLGSSPRARTTPPVVVLASLVILIAAHTFFPLGLGQ